MFQLGDFCNIARIAARAFYCNRPTSREAFGGVEHLSAQWTLMMKCKSISADCETFCLQMLFDLENAQITRLGRKL